MAQLYFNEQLIATSDIHGILGHHLSNEEIVITYPHKPRKFYTILMYDDKEIHSFIMNVKGDDLETGDIIVDYKPFEHRALNYHAIIFIYEQPKKLPLPLDDFDMEDYIQKYQLQLLYTIHFTVLQKLDRKPNIYSQRVFHNKLMTLQNK